MLQPAIGWPRHAPACGAALILLLGIGRSVATAQAATPVTATEAQILLYVTPIANRVRASGGDVGMDLESRANAPGEDFYYYQLRDAKAPRRGQLVGNFAVNKHTAQVWDNDQHQQLHGAVMSGVQAIIRRAHNIDQAALRRYGGKKPS